MKLKPTLICSLAFVFALSGCATKVIPAYQAKSVSTYRLSDTNLNVVRTIFWMGKGNKNHG